MLQTEYDHNLPSHVLEDAKDVYTPPGPGSNMRSRLIRDSGVFRLARRTASLYSVEIKTCGSWGKLIAIDGNGEWKFYVPSVFTGSFVIEACMPNGLIFYSQAGPGSDAICTVNWREADAQII